MTPLIETGLYKLIEGRHGRFLANPRDIYIGRSLIEYGEFSEHEVMFLQQLVPPGGVVIEAGANIGSITVPLARKAGAGGMIHAFEPQMLVFQQLCANLALNDLTNVQALNAGCGAEPGEIAIIRHDPARDNNFGGIPLERLRSETDRLRIRIERLDQILSPARLDLIKADVEGMELAVLQGAQALIETFRPALYVENHDPESSPALIAHIEALDYRCWWHLPRLFNPDNFAGKRENLFAGITSKNMVCLPRERATRVERLRPVASAQDHPTRWR